MSDVKRYRKKPVIVEALHYIGNPEHFTKHQLKKHSLATEYDDVPTEFETLKTWICPLSSSPRLALQAAQ